MGRPSPLLCQMRDKRPEVETGHDPGSHSGSVLAAKLLSIQTSRPFHL